MNDCMSECNECNTIVGVPSDGWADRVSVGSLLRAS